MDILTQAGKIGMALERPHDHGHDHGALGQHKHGQPYPSTPSPRPATSQPAKASTYHGGERVGVCHIR